MRSPLDSMRLQLLLALVMLQPAAFSQSSTATYAVTFESTWSSATHPDDFPPDPHFSGLVGAVHDATAALWEPGGLASPGMESMAETGSKTLLEGEVNVLIGAGSAFAVLSGGGIGLSPGSVSLTFDVNTAYPLVSLVSMLAPSPDWFVGVHGLSLEDGNSWVADKDVTLFVYDAGTDSGLMYTSPDSPTQPPETIRVIASYPFFYDGDIRAVGSFRFTLLNVTDRQNDLPATDRVSLEGPFPNPASAETMARINVGTPDHLQIALFDSLGRRVRTLFEGVMTAGSHLLPVATGDLPGGIYIVRVLGRDTLLSQRFVVLN